MKIAPPIVIFVRPIAHGNVGALARVMSNFGVKSLRLVREPTGEAAFDKEHQPLDWGLACRGESVLKEMQIFSTLEEALHDVHWAVATTARMREKDSGYTRPIQDYSEVLNKIKTEKTGQKWALVFGPEDDGLSDADTSLCHCLSTIDTQPESPSMNIAMAAGCLLYHWSISNKELNEKASKPLSNSEVAAAELATAGDIEKLSLYISETLKTSEFFKYPDEVAALARIRRIFQNEAPPTRGDILFIFEIFYQLRSKIQGQYEDRNFLK
ncbi:MAG: RNA methyltransferase [Bdellovibrionota bacterium]